MLHKQIVILAKQYGMSLNHKNITNKLIILDIYFPKIYFKNTYNK
jgi:hypothetical protein